MLLSDLHFNLHTLTFYDNLKTLLDLYFSADQEQWNLHTCVVASELIDHKSQVQQNAYAVC